MKDRGFIAGLRTVLLGIILYIMEFLYLPVFANLQKSLVDGNGFHTKIMEYVKEPPYPQVFLLTGLVVVIGILLCVKSYRDQKKAEHPEK